MLVLHSTSLVEANKTVYVEREEQYFEQRVQEHDGQTHRNS